MLETQLTKEEKLKALEQSIKNSFETALVMELSKGTGIKGLQIRDEAYDVVLSGLVEYVMLSDDCDALETLLRNLRNANESRAIEMNDRCNKSYESLVQNTLFLIINRLKSNQLVAQTAQPQDKSEIVNVTDATQQRSGFFFEDEHSDS